MTEDAIRDTHTLIYGNVGLHTAPPKPPLLIFLNNVYTVWWGTFTPFVRFTEVNELWKAHIHTVATKFTASEGSFASSVAFLILFYFFLFLFLSPPFTIYFPVFISFCLSLLTHIHTLSPAGLMFCMLTSHLFSLYECTIANKMESTNQTHTCRGAFTHGVKSAHDTVTHITTVTDIHTLMQTQTLKKQHLL